MKECDYCGKKGEEMNICRIVKYSGAKNDVLDLVERTLCPECTIDWRKHYENA